MPDFTGRILLNNQQNPLSLIKFNDVLSDIKYLKELASTYQLDFVGY